MTDTTLTHYRQIIGHRLRSAREARGLSCAALADRAGIQPDHLASFEQGDISPSVDDLQRLAAKLRFPIAHFVDACQLCGSPD